MIYRQIAIAGSHKAAAVLPNRGPPEHDLLVLERVPMRKGDVLIFMASALTHGAMPWLREGGRRTVVMGYIYDNGVGSRQPTIASL